MGTFKSNLDHVSRTYGLTALKDRLATCFQHWHSRAQSTQGKIGRPRDRQHAFVKTSEHFKSFNSTFWEIFSPAKQSNRFERVRRKRDGDRVQIVTQILSSTLITTSAKSVYYKDQETVQETANSMAIIADAFLSVRAEYPDLDVEVRSILISRSQEGATIEEIKEDYRKNTGVNFPIYTDITGFLLSIPMVMAYCNESGTLIFNVMPSSKTKHIYDMVQYQRPRQQEADNATTHDVRRRHLPSYLFRGGKRESCEPGAAEWYNKAEYDLNVNYQHTENIYNGYDGRTTPLSSRGMEINTELPPQLPMNMNVDQSASDAASDRTANNYYRDNCNYLYNRLHNPPMAPARTGHNFQYNENTNVIRHTVDLNRIAKSYSIAKNHTNALNQLRNMNQPLPESLRLQERHLYNSNNYDDKRMNSSNSDSMYTSDSDFEAHLLDFPLLGDDFFLYMARMELNCKFKKLDGRVFHSGLCVSGQTIQDAIKRVQQMESRKSHVIVNIGSVDIMKGRSLVQIEHDYRELLNVMNRKDFTPILTTLGPLANYAHEPNVKLKLERFNEFIKKVTNCLKVIDIWACLVNERGHIMFDCFQHGPRRVTGTTEPHVFWNKIGRQRVLQMIESNLEY